MIFGLLVHTYKRGREIRERDSEGERERERERDGEGGLSKHIGSDVGPRTKAS